jgi:hypothetical protein
MLRLMIGGFAAITSGLFSGLAVIPVKTSPPPAIVISGPSLPVPGPILTSRPEATPSSPKLEPAAAPISAPRSDTADEPATPAASTKAKSAPIAATRAKLRNRMARQVDDDDDEC